ncbi:MAG: hypothetical protein D6713_01305 [Deltaproteobacteria bacterium]|nr:MAG: hypothetical protein D6713_01305 [Deltaproteobacteria bacterium]
MRKVVPTGSLREFFSQRLDEALRETSTEVLEETRAYLLDILEEFTWSRRAFSLERENPEEPLSVRFLRALEKSAGERVREHRMIGDFCLFLTGFFSDFLQRKVADMEVYISLGSSAYSSVETALRSFSPVPEDTFTRMFRELAEKFPSLVEVYMDLSEKLMVQSEQDLLKIYEKYLILKSKRYEKILREAGIEPFPVRRSRH